jgi:hypothetical protein
MSSVVEAQKDSVKVKVKPPTRYQLIGHARQVLGQAFASDDPAGASLWMDSLARLEDDRYVGLVWDERRLLYFWEGAYGNLFEEAAGFDPQKQASLAEKTQPPEDTLFKLIDLTLYSRRFDLFQDIRKAFLTTEERAYATLELENLLRLNSDKEAWNAKVDSFLRHFPNTRFKNDLSGTRLEILRPAKYGFSLYLLFDSGTWNGALTQSMTPLFGADFGLTYWNKRFNAGINMEIGADKVGHDIFVGTNKWPKGDPASFLQVEAELGYDVVNTSRLRVFPTIGGGYTSLKPTEKTDDDGNNLLPDYYESFKFSGAHLLFALTTDLKFTFARAEEYGIPKGSYNGLRVKCGYKPMFLGKKNHALEGGMFFVSIGYTFFSYGMVK